MTGKCFFLASLPIAGDSSNAPVALNAFVLEPSGEIWEILKTACLLIDKVNLDLRRE